MDLNQTLKDKELRITKKRKLILEKIIENEGPISAEKILDMVKEDKIKLDLSTIYRNLNLMEKKNLLLKNTNTDGISYYQINNHNHKHFITCISCNKKFIIDNCPINNIEKDLEDETGFVIKGHSFEFTGICPNCQEKLNK